LSSITPSSQGGIDPEIERFLQIRGIVRSLVRRASVMLDANVLPKSARALAAFVKEFEAEVGANLLRIYEDGP
jgi:hypothetical protein